MPSYTVQNTIFKKNLTTWVYIKQIVRGRVHKTFQNQDQDQAQVKQFFTMDFLKPTIIIQLLTVGI